MGAGGRAGGAATRSPHFARSTGSLGTGPPGGRVPKAASTLPSARTAVASNSSLRLCDGKDASSQPQDSLAGFEQQRQEPRKMAGQVEG